MVALWSQFREVAVDWRVWVLTVGLLGWYALEGLVSVPAGPGYDLVFAPVNWLTYAYLYSIGLVFVTLGAQPGFWIGFGLWCFVLSACVIGLFELLSRRV